MPKNKVTSEDVPFQMGEEGGMPKRAAKQIEADKKRRKSRLDSIMDQMRRAQTTDSHQ